MCALHHLPMFSVDGSFLLRGPQRELLERAARIAADGLRRERGRLISEVVLDEEVLLDAAERAGRGGQTERGLVRNGAEDDRRDVVGVPKSDSCFVGGVDRLDGLMNRWEIGADNDVNVALGGFLRVLHKSSFE